MIQLKRVYDPVSPDDGKRYLVERLWPRGVKKTALKIDAWLKDAAPSAALRHWFSHDPGKWEAFRRRYYAELDANPGAWELIRTEAGHGDVTLVYSSRDTEHNNALALRDYLRKK